MNKTGAFVLLTVGLFVAAGLSLGVGSVSIPLTDILRSLMPHGSEPMTATIVLDIRLPRMLLAVMVGGGVAAAGAAIQGLFRNPLADPALIGVSSGAALFAAGFLVLGIQADIVRTLGLSGSAFVGVALAWFELSDSPAPLTALTT